MTDNEFEAIRRECDRQLQMKRWRTVKRRAAFVVRLLKLWADIHG